MPKSIKKLIILSSLTVFLSLAVSVWTASAAWLAWDANTDQVEGYIIYYGTSATNLSQSVEVGTVTSYNLDDFNLSENIRYYFSLAAYNAAGESPRTATVDYIKESQSQVDTTPPSPPSGLTATLPTN